MKAGRLARSARPERAPCALAIGGLDPGGGAGLAADLRAFSAAGVFGCAAAAVLTVQSTAGLRTARAVPADEVVAQVNEVLRHQRVAAIKVGALGSEANVRAVSRRLAGLARRAMVPVVVDTPMRPTRGKGRLLAERALDAVRTELVPRATLLTVNVDEAEALLGATVRSVSHAHDASLALAAMGARAVLVKGGHLTGASATDVLALDGEVVELRAPRLRALAIHGTGCTFASLIAGRLAARRGTRVSSAELVKAIRWAKRVHHASLGRAVDVGGTMRVLVF